MIVDALALVREWHADDGCGRVVVTGSGDVVWVHFSVIQGRSFASLRIGEEVRVSYLPVGHVGHAGDFQAERVVPVEDVDSGVAEPLPPGAAYRSSLTIVDDPE